MRHSTRRVLALLALAAVAACGCGARTYGQGLRRLAPFGVRAGWVDFREFEIAPVGDRPLVGLYLRTSVKGRAILELAADAALDPDEIDERQFYSGGASLLLFPSQHGSFYLHAGAGAMSETNPLNDYLDAYASLGAGWSVPAGPTRLDFRAGVWLMIDSANITQAAALTLGYGF